MSDPFGSPRTLSMHRESSLRNIQRANAQDVAADIGRSTLHAAVVVDIDPFSGAVRLDRFSRVSPEGRWVGPQFSCLNFSSPKIGDTVLYAYLEESPVVLGMLPQAHDPWRVPSLGDMQDDFVFEDFDNGSTVSGGIGRLRWMSVVNAGAVVLTNAGIDLGHPGQVVLATTGTAGSYVYIHPALALLPDTLDQMQWLLMGASSRVGGGNVTTQILVGMTDNGVTLANSIGFISGSAGSTWLAWVVNGGVTKTQDLGIPYEDNVWWRLNLQRQGIGEWGFTATNMNTGESARTLMTGCPGVPLVPYSRAYQVTTTTAGAAYIDYAWWSRIFLKR